MRSHLCCKTYDFKAIEKRWHKIWADNQTFHVTEDINKKKYYVLDMFPYPSAAGLHIGHPEGYTASDIITRYKRACGYNVLHPMGWDAFGLPAEQHAIKTGINPALNTANNIEHFREQIKKFGFAIDWEREINTTDPNYYRWTQWIFLQLFKHGLAYVDERPVWWCSELKSVLANEEVINGRSERGNYPVKRRNLRQWILKITDYADQLLNGLNDVDWPESTKRQQRVWIGRSEGTQIKFDVKGHASKITVYSTRPDTLFGVTFLVLAPEHESIFKITTKGHVSKVNRYINEIKSKSDLERTDLAKEKTGVFTGAYAIHPITKALIPIWVADYVLPSYGTGAVMAVPAHDERDYEFAQKYGLPVKQVIQNNTVDVLPYTGDGRLINSDEFDGVTTEEAKSQISEFLIKNKVGKNAVNYKLRDWLFSRQRYWGEPIPIIWIDKVDYEYVTQLPNFYFKEFLPEKAVSYTENKSIFCAIPLTSQDLPLMLLPNIGSYLPSENGESPLANEQNWVNVYVNAISGEIISVKDFQTNTPGLWIRGRRETNTMPQWAGSCWYHLRYMSPKHSTALVESTSEKYWLGPDMYIGGAEHAVLHLLYARFWHKFLYNIGIVSTSEPFKKLFHQGIILGEDGVKMSKSKGNVINPDEVIDQYGADALRLYEMFLGPLEAMKPWSSRGIEGMFRFLKKIWKLFVKEDGNVRDFSDVASNSEKILINTAINKVTQDIDNMRFNTAISQLMICLNGFGKESVLSRDSIVKFLQILAPFAPHIAEEIYSRINMTDDTKTSIIDLGWPKASSDVDARVADTKIALQFNGKLRGELTIDNNSSQEDIINRIKANEKFNKYLVDKSVVKVVYIPNKLINLVVK